MIQVLETPATTRIGALIDSLETSWNRHDMRAYAALFAEDADFVNVVGMHWRGRAEILATHVRLHETIFRDSAIRPLDYSVRLVGPDVAHCIVSWEMTGAHGLENWQVPQVRTGKMSLVLTPAENSPSGWMIAALHNTEAVNISMADVK
ncbi:MAG: SgcJ/EcaC family oxidoreductase [Bryobacteraceae bacterium]